MGTALALALLALAGLPGAAHANTSTFKGRFVCDDRGVQTPIAGALIQLWAESAPENSTLFKLDTWGSGFAHTDTTGPDGEWSFTMDADPDHPYNYHPVLVLDDGSVSVGDFPSFQAWFKAWGENQDDRAVQDYHTLVVSEPECALWLGLKRAFDDYTRIMGREPSWNLRATYGAPLGHPLVDFTSIYWTSGYVVDPTPGGYSAAFRLFAHTIRNHSLDNTPAGRRRGLVTRPWRPCQTTNTDTAFSYGWAEFWAGTFAPAPNCGSLVSPTNMAVEGNVAAALTQLNAHCAGASRRRMLEAMIRGGPAIHTFGKFRALLRPCQAEPLDPSVAVSRVRISPPTQTQRWRSGLSAQLRTIKRRISDLGKRERSARRDARRATCRTAPCFDTLLARTRPALLAGQLAQARLLARTLSVQLSRRSRRQAANPTLAYLDRLGALPGRLARGLGTIGVASIDRALRDARSIIRRDHSVYSTRLISVLRSDRRAFARARRSGVGLPVGFPIAGAKVELPAAPPSGPTEHLINFDGIPDGTLITTQTAAAGATFGGAAALGFPGAVPRHMCNDGPTAQGGAAVAPACPSDIEGFTNTGTMARLTDPATSVSVRIGATIALPGGSAADLDGFDANGNQVAANAELVGTPDQGPGLTRSVRIGSPGGAPIVYLALVFDGSSSSGTRLVFDDLTYSG